MWNVDIDTVNADEFPFSNDMMAFLSRDEYVIEANAYVGSVDLSKVIGTHHPDYHGHTWGELKPDVNKPFQYLKRSNSILRELKFNPEYMVKNHEGNTSWSFYKIFITGNPGPYSYVQEGNHRTVMARFFLYLNNLPPVIHGVGIQPIIPKSFFQKKKELYEEKEALKKPGFLNFPTPAPLPRECQ